MISPSEETLLLNALDMAVFERLADGSLVLTGRTPGWFERICPMVRSRQYRSALTTASPFLEDFLVQAEELWSSPQGRLYSGDWVQRDIDGFDRNIEAWALNTGPRQFLVLRLLGAEFEETRRALQNLRASNLARELPIHEARSQRNASSAPALWFTRVCLAFCCVSAMAIFAADSLGVQHFQLGHGLTLVVGALALASIAGLILLALIPMPNFPAGRKSSSPSLPSQPDVSPGTRERG